MKNTKQQLIIEQVDKKLKAFESLKENKIPTNGFLIKEKQKERSIIGEEFKASGLSLMAIPFFRSGKNFVDENGEEHFFEDYTFPAKPAKSYAFCSDTAPLDSLVEDIHGVDCLYHEATFLHELINRAQETFHSTAIQAAQVAIDVGAKQLLIGHYSSRYSDISDLQTEAASLFENVIAVEDGMIIKIV